MKIVKFKKTSKDKYKVYLDDNSCISLYEDVIINNNLLLTKEIEKSKIEDIIKQNNKYNLYMMALNYISIRVRSKKEVITYLEKKGAYLKDIDNTIERLTKEGYVNDFSYAKAYVNDQMLLSPSGPYKIKSNLIKNGVSSDIALEVIEDIDNELLREKLYNLIGKQIRIKKGSKNEIKMKLLNYFINLGYDKNMILDELGKYEIKTDTNRLTKEYSKIFNKYSKKYKGNELDYFIKGKLLSKGYSLYEIEKIKKDF